MQKLNHGGPYVIKMTDNVKLCKIEINKLIYAKFKETPSLFEI